MASSFEITQLLIEWSDGSDAALDKLMPLVYVDLRRIAARYMAAQRPAHTLQATALIHEAYLRIASKSGGKFENRAHFFALAAKAMRHILVDHARAQTAVRRGAHERPTALSDETASITESSDEVLALDESLSVLATLCPRQSNVVELRYFGGLSNQEIGQTLGISEETVMRDWRAARAWLYLRLHNTGSQPIPSAT